MFREINDNIWNFPDDVKVITTNGNIKNNGTAVMGKGIALQASERFPTLSLMYAEHLRNYGISCAYYHSYKLILFPTKYNWKEKSILNLIRKSMEELAKICRNNNIKRVVIPRVGCGNGLLEWNVVKRSIQYILDSDDIEFVIVGV